MPPSAPEPPDRPPATAASSLSISEGDWAKGGPLSER
jgi:hypothetical protein